MSGLSCSLIYCASIPSLCTRHLTAPDGNGAAHPDMPCAQPAGLQALCSQAQQQAATATLQGAGQPGGQAAGRGAAARPGGREGLLRGAWGKGLLSLTVLTASV